MDVSRKIFTQLFNIELVKQNKIVDHFLLRGKKKRMFTFLIFLLSESNYGESKVRLGGLPNNSPTEKPSVRN